jgi:membrane protease YdiL (CAAX protease family)
MTLFSVCLIFLTLTLCYQTRPNYFIKENNETNLNTTSYKHIFYPEYAMEDFIGEIYGYSLLIAPVTDEREISTSIDLCSSFEFLAQNKWNNTNVKNPCELYFCGEFSPKYLNDSQNLSFSLQERLIAEQNHESLHRYCTLCSQTKNENFQKILNEKQCKYFIPCPKDRCSDESLCLHFRPRHPLCYVWKDGIFYNFDDFTHRYLYWIYYRYSRIFPLLMFILFNFFIVLFIAIPDIVKIIKERMNGKDLRSTLQSIFSLRSLSLMIIIILNIFFIASLCVDIAGFFVVRISNILCSIGCMLVNIVNNFFIILWQHVLAQSKDLSLKFYSLWTYLKIILVLIFFLFFGSLGSFFYGAYFLIDNGKRVVFLYLLGVYILFLVFVLCIVVIFLIIHSLRIFFSINKFKKFNEKIFKFFSTNVRNSDF